MGMRKVVVCLLIIILGLATSTLSADPGNGVGPENRVAPQRTTPNRMAFQPPAGSDELADFVPPGLTMRTAVAGHVSLPIQANGGASHFRNQTVAVVV